MSDRAAVTIARMPSLATIVVHHTGAATHHGGGTPVGVIIVAALAALLVLACVAWGAARWAGREPRWWSHARESLTEVGWHAQASWSDFADWLRLGR